MPDELSQFEPTQAMLDALVAAKDCNYSKFGAQVCKDAGLSRQVWYTWVDLPGFLEFWDAHGDKHAKARLAELRNAVMDSALEKTDRQGLKRQPAALALAMQYADAQFRSKETTDAANANQAALAAFLELAQKRTASGEADGSDAD